MNLRVSYFKTSGKWYAEAEFDLPDATPHWEIRARLLALSAFPGLMGRWAGYIVIDSKTDTGFPPILIPAVEPEPRD